MISSLKSVGGSCRAYIGAIGQRQATSANAHAAPAGAEAWNYDNFTNMNPL
jgi:hypothetical protein